eukprot:scaffold7782_cov113-Isochrysis_galbana.AAC.2
MRGCPSACGAVWWWWWRCCGGGSGGDGGGSVVVVLALVIVAGCKWAQAVSGIGGQPRTRAHSADSSASQHPISRTIDASFASLPAALASAARLRSSAIRNALSRADRAATPAAAALAARRSLASEAARAQMAQARRAAAASRRAESKRHEASRAEERCEARSSARSWGGGCGGWGVRAGEEGIGKVKVGRTCEEMERRCCARGARDRQTGELRGGRCGAGDWRGRLARECDLGDERGRWASDINPRDWRGELTPECGAGDWRGGGGGGGTGRPFARGRRGRTRLLS